MTPLQIAWVVSTTGAILFFVAGFLLARRHVPELLTVDHVVPPPLPSSHDDPGIVAALHQELGQLRSALRDARGNAAETARRDLALEIEGMRRRTAEIEQVEQENAELRARSAHEAELTEQVAALQAEVRDLRSRPAPASGRTISPTRPPTRPPTARPDGRFTSDELAALLSRVSNRKTQSIALADELGLAIVGVGEELSSLAAFAAYVTDIGNKSRVFLPLGPIARVTLEDDSDNQVTAFPHDTGNDSRVVLVSLTAGAGPSTRGARDVLRQVVRMIQ